MINFAAYDEHELRNISEMLAARMRYTLLQAGFTPRDANVAVAEAVACGLKIAHCDGLVKGPVPRLRVVGK